MNTEKRKKRRIKNLICMAYCSIQLLVVLLVFTGMEHILDKLIAGGIGNPLSGQITVMNNEDDTRDDEEGLLICLDAGHGGKDNGSDYQDRYEKDDNLKLTLAVAEYLEGQGVRVILTRNDDTFLKLSQRCEFANEKQADYFVSLHRNTGDGAGVETWIYSQADAETKELANFIMEGLEVAGIQRNRGVKVGTQKSSSKDYYINSNSNMPSCIVELGFLNNATDNQLFDEKYKEYAKAIGEAIIKACENNNGNDSADIPEQSGDSQPEDSETIPVMQTAMIENVESLDNTSQDWGQGNNMDDKNRPVSAISFQEKYEGYNGLFIGEESNTIYLTLDEGYEYGFTESILNTLKEKNVPAVFFVTEPYAKDQPDLVKRMIAEGHVLGNHSVTHPAAGLPSQSIEKQQEEVMGNHRYIQENFGYEMHLFRYPAGKFSQQSLAVVNNCNYKSVFWSFAYVDYDVKNQPDHAQSLDKMITKLHPGAIYLLHAESETNAAVLGDFIDRVRAAGYEFALLT